MQKKSPAKLPTKPASRPPAGRVSGEDKLAVAPAPAKMAVAKAAPVATTAKAAPSRDEIARRAFEIYMGRGQVAGRELEDWSQAERELIAERHRNN